MIKFNIVLLTIILVGASSKNSFIDYRLRNIPYDPGVGYVSTSSSSTSSSSSTTSSASSSSSTSSSSSSSTEADYFKCSRYGPFPLENCNDLNASFTYELHSISSQKIIERIRLSRVNGNILASSSKGAYDYVTGTKKTVSFTIPLKDYWQSNGLTLFFEILNASNYKVLKRYSATFYPILNDTVPASTLKDGVYESRSFGFKGDGETMIETTESFDFSMIGNYVNVNNYYCLDLTNNFFQYLNIYSLTYISVNLRFNDKERLFPYLTHEDNGDIIVPLKLYKKGNDVTFKLKNNYYVNKKTLQISEIYRIDNDLTNRFYLPINGKKVFNGKMIYIDIKDLGINKISTTIPLRYDVDKSLVGVCTEGDNCVVGGNS